jgi:hypothetical protein
MTVMAERRMTLPAESERVALSAAEPRNLATTVTVE